MGIYYIKTADNRYFELDSTTDMTVSMPGRATDFPLEDGESASDHYINESIVVSFSGIVSDVKSISSKGLIGDDSTKRLKGTSDYIKGLEAVKKTKQPFTVFYSPNLDPITNCVFESLDITQNATHGTRGTGCSSYEISFTAKQIRIGEQAQMTSMPVPAEDIKKSLSNKTTSSGSTQGLTAQETDKAKEEAREQQLAELVKSSAETRKEIDDALEERGLQ